MTDLSKLLKEVQRTEASHVDMLRRHSCGTLQWFLEKDTGTHPIHNRNHLEFLVCGEAGFAAIERDIRAATRTIDLVLWGFDPGMELVRATPPTNSPASAWPRGTTYGDLLTQKAREGVQVRLLLWYDSILSNFGAGNVPDLPLAWLPTPASPVEAPSPQWLKNHAHTRAGVLDARSDYCKAWWKAALLGRFANLEVRMRAGSPSAIHANIGKYMPDQVTVSEAVTLKLAGTHHQKPVLIDYGAMPAPGQRPTTCGYVMGLNSVTDYWDTDRHLYNDPRREVSDAGLFWTEAWHCKPYRDYAIRVQGEALYNINENFVQAWDRIPPSPGSMDRGAKLKAKRQSVQPKDIPAPAEACHRAQIVRTQPESLDATILKAYTLASSNAVNYIYVENQYFQLSDWAKLVKKMRGQYCDGMKAAGTKPADIVPLHLFVVIPQPERGGMVPRTYEAVGNLGAGKNMGEYHGEVQGKRKADQSPPAPLPANATPFEQAQHNKRLHDYLLERHASDIVRDSVEAVPADPQGELNALGIKPLVAMLMTHDAAGERKKIRISSRDSEGQDAEAAKEAKTNKSGRASDVDDYGVDIVPKAYREIYIHSKLMFVDDVYTTLGSANLNARSMVSDSELNICTAEYGFTQDARRRVWGNLAGEDLNGGDGIPKNTADTFDGWKKRTQNNKKGRTDSNGLPENGSFIHPFEDHRGVPAVRLA